MEWLIMEVLLLILSLSIDMHDHVAQFSSLFLQELIHIWVYYSQVSAINTTVVRSECMEIIAPGM